MDKENQPYMYGAVRIQNGKYKDQILILQKKEILWVGREPGCCNLILEAPWISRKHCGISYDERKGKYIVVDCSENGTYMEDGTRLTKGKDNILAKNVVIMVGEQGIRLHLL
ncbi:MAG: FHA domain-containing protein [Lachnospiraceae bacterium]